MGSSSRPWLRNAFHAVFVFSRTLSCFYLFSKYGCFLSRVSGPSMHPTFLGRNDLVLVEAVSPWLGRIEEGTGCTGDVVICVRPVDPREHIIKRVVAVAGQEVLLFPDQQHAQLRHVQVPAGHVWIQGDNLPHSLDSRVYGPVPLALVKGRVVCQVWPSFKLTTASAAGFPGK